ncbi:MAG TPA: hypothetical protein ENG01_00380 [Candidatus Aenigmarchaeota archaeon]|nr:MAG: hypothetical protein DRN75_01530 [Nanoarchaeota archaeon]HDO79801.1 hypothetical protein [Candidatus Aenigmarchaeota archaeon]HEX32853.1 hypothetical protein [Candidatus Aenigmarchaeota archaeon]
MILVDRREKLVIDAMKSLGVKFKVEQLPLGDIVVGKTVIERKTMKDFVSSIIDRRLFTQVNRLKGKGMLIIEGREYDNLVSQNAVRGATLYVVKRIPVIFTDDVYDTVQYVLLMSSPDQKKYLSLRPKPKLTGDRLLIYIMQGFPGVGPETAKNLLSKFRTLERVFSASEEDLASVPGIGKYKAKLIKSVLKRRYRG